AAGDVPSERLHRRGARGDARDHRAEGCLRAPYQPDPPRPRHLPPTPALHRVRPTPHVPVLQAEQDEYAAAPVKRSNFVIFGLVVLVVGVGIPAWAITREGAQSDAEEVPSSLQEGKDLFVINCGAFPTLAKD